MHIIIWRFTPRTGREAEFVSHYATGGAWDLLFRNSPGFLGTELLRPTEHDRAWVTIDRWRSEEAFAAFLREHHGAYAELDEHCETLTSEEVRVGIFSAVAPLQR